MTNYICSSLTWVKSSVFFQVWFQFLVRKLFIFRTIFCCFFFKYNSEIPVLAGSTSRRLSQFRNISNGVKDSKYNLTVHVLKLHRFDVHTAFVFIKILFWTEFLKFSLEIFYRVSKLISYDLYKVSRAFVTFFEL